MSVSQLRAALQVVQMIEDQGYACPEDSIKNALHRYAALGFETVNRHLRSCPEDAELDTIGARYAALINQAPLLTIAQPLTVWRGISLPDACEDLASYEAGNIICDKAYMSTSLRRDLARHASIRYTNRKLGPNARKRFLLKIRLEKGTSIIPAYWIMLQDNIWPDPLTVNEMEILLPPSTPLEVTRNVRTNREGITVLECSMNPQDAALKEAA